MLSAIVERCANRKKPIATFELHGGVPAEDRVKVTDEWGNAEPGAMVAMISVARVGLNMASYSSTVLFANKAWNPGMNQQAIDRVHRVGADMARPVQVHDFIVLNTVDEKVESALDLKIETATEIVGDSKKLSRKLFAALQEDVSND